MVEKLVEHVEYDVISYKTSDGKIFRGEEEKSRAEAYEEYLSKKESIEEFLKFHKKEFRVPEPYIGTGTNLAIDEKLECYIIDNEKSKELLIEYFKYKFFGQLSCLSQCEAEIVLEEISQFADYGKWIAVTYSGRVLTENYIIKYIDTFISECEKQKKENIRICIWRRLK